MSREDGSAEGRCRDDGGCSTGVGAGRDTWLPPATGPGAPQTSQTACHTHQGCVCVCVRVCAVFLSLYWGDGVWFALA